MSLAGLAVLLGGLLTVSVFNGTSQAALPRNCDNNSIIYCGAVDVNELTQKYNENKTGDLAAIYSAYGINAASFGSAKMGEVRKDGTVVVNGEVVATNAYSIGRQNIAGSTPKTIGGKTYYNSPNSTAFLSNSIAAFVFFNADGTFKSFIITSCANPGDATPKPPKEKPPVEKPKPPVYKCDALSMRMLSGEQRRYAFDLAYTAQNGAVLKTVDYDFGDGTGQEGVAPENAKTVEHTYAKAGTYTTTATLHFSVENTVKDAKCKVTITTSPEMCPLNPTLPKDDERCAPCPIPGKEQFAKDSPYCVTPPVTPPELPKTGPMDFVAGGVAMSSLLLASYYWFLSRRDIATALISR
jgi:hypothetical protein